MICPMKQHTKLLIKMNACNAAVRYAENFDTLQDAWDVCERGDWMLWLIGKKSGLPESKSRKKLVLTSCKCVRLAWKWMPKEGKEAIRITEKWAKGNAGTTLKDVRTAADAAYAAADAAADATYAPAYAADATYAAADAADAPADAAYAAADAAYAAARKDILKKCAIIVRKEYPKAPKI